MMRNPILLVLLVGAALPGCARRSPPLPHQSQHISSAVAALPTPPPVAPAPVEAADARERAAHWGKKLFSDDPAERWEAGKNLGELEDAGYPYLLKGLRADQAPVRLTALEALPPAVAHKQQKEVVPILLELLKDRDAKVRNRACLALPWADQLLGDNEIQAGAMASERLLALKIASDRDTDPGVRAAARISAQRVQQAIAGKLSPVGVGVGGDGGKVGSGARSGDQSAPKRVLPR